MKFRVTFSRIANIELDQIVVYIGAESPAAAVQVSKRIFAKIDLLQDHPWLGRPGKRSGTRELIVEHTPYIVAYRVNTDERRILVLRIVHHAQRWPEKL